MRVPQVSDRLKEVPAQALRGVFAGIGQLLLITDKLRNKTPAGTDVPRARAPESAETVPQETVTDTDTAADAVPAAREAAEPVAPEAPDAPEAPVASRPPRTSAATQEPAAAETAKAPRVSTARDFDKTGNVRLLGGADVAARTDGKTAKAGKADPGRSAEADAPAPLPNFDELSVPSLRARLRNLDIGQVRQMLEYERTHAARPEVITMFERRVAKLEAEA
jgi:hypothetical protein